MCDVGFFGRADVEGEFWMAGVVRCFDRVGVDVRVERWLVVLDDVLR